MISLYIRKPVLAAQAIIFEKFIFFDSVKSYRFNKACRLSHKKVEQIISAPPPSPHNLSNLRETFICVSFSKHPFTYGQGLY